MKQSKSALFGCLSLLCAIAISLFATSSARAQATEDENKVIPTAADRAAAEQATVIYRHVRLAKTPAASELKQNDVTARRQSSAPQATARITADNDQLRYPADVINNGGPVVDTAMSHAIYLLPKNGSCNKISKCWGNPEGFLNDLSGSDFIHVVDQYIGMAGGHRYTVGVHASIDYTPPAKGAPLSDMDIQGFVHGVAFKTGLSGYKHIYHVFLPPGQDVCLLPNGSDPNAQTCYSPDNPSSFVFCAYHNSVDFTDKVGHVLYTVEPFQDVSGCAVRPTTANGKPTPNGQLADSTYNSLSHELVETITDPDGSAWWNSTNFGLFGLEIGDECTFFVINSMGEFNDPSVVVLGRHSYAIQPEYSNSEHACATSP